MTNHWDLMFIAILAVTMNMVNSATTAQNTCTDSQRLEGPIIEPCQSEIILQKGQNYTLTCKAKFAVGFIQQDISQEITTINMKQRNESITEGEYKYKMVLELYNVDQYTVGYYACYDEKINMSIMLKNLTEEPVNTPSVSFIYIYVNGTDFLFAPMRQVITPRNRFLAVIECKPTTPDVQVSLKESRRNKNPVSVTFSPKIGFILGTCSRIGYMCIGQLGKKFERIRIPIDTPPPTPRISGRNEFFLEGENFTINCTITYIGHVLVNLKWEYPPNADNSSIIVHTNENEVIETGLKLFKNITIVNATREHGGTYKCISTNNCDEKTVSFQKTFKEEATLELYTDKVQPVTSTQPKYTLNIEIDAYPEPSFYFTKNGVRLPSENNSKYRVYKKSSTGDAMLFINNTEVTDSANYTLVADNGYLKKNITVDIRFKGPPKITFGSNAVKKYVENMRVTLRCDVIAWPFPGVDWIFSYGEKEQILPSATIEALSVYKASATLVFPRIHASGNITCRASNEWGTRNVTRRLIVYEVDGGFGIKNRDNTWFPQNQDVTLICVASKFDFSSVDWIGVKEENLTEMVEQTENPLSLVAKLKIPQISLTQSGEYTCRGVRFDGKEAVEPINISVEATRSPVISDPLTDVTEEVYRKQKMQLTCLADGVPAPTIEWSKDAVIFKNDSNVEILTTTFNRTFVNSTIKFEVNDNYTGTYECLASSEGAIARRTYTLVSGQSTYVTYLSVIIVIVLILIILVIYLTIKIRKEKAFRRELAAAGLLYFKEGITKSLNPDLGIDEQAELLPYDDKFEFPAERLILGKQLGAGAFGVVYKAEARGIINAEETTEVAVKMVKKTADNMYIKALASELKIMVHLGKHVNIVNLLGACTKNVGKRELSVIVEYCKFGNIHNYMQRHREVFIDQLTDNKEKNLGRVNRGFSCSSGSTGAHSDYFGACNTQETDHTFVNSANTNRSARKNIRNQQVELVKVSEGYVQPEWRSNYESDYSFDGRNPRPLTSRDLLAWAFQIARGMEYLASRKVLHGDLAARNVLLAEDNIVKICDFGLARSIYKNDEYQKKENFRIRCLLFLDTWPWLHLIWILLSYIKKAVDGPRELRALLCGFSLLPVKWLAIECMTDRIFSTQSDVWSFGIVLWELFTLAKTPYPNMDPAHLLRWLSEGNRLAKPTYADDKIYDVMLRCWEQKPTTRPSFSQLQEIIGGFLEDNVRNHYVDLNTAYIDMNATPSGYEDYLIMMNAPDYNNLVTPSPHHYVNDVRNFFPTTPTELDEEGYLKMNTRQNIFSPRPEDSKFDFDVRKFNPKESEASSCGSELTPMLTLNNLPARGGSESDHEGSASPNITMCPTIDEETDEVFEMKNRNAKNVMMNTAVSNPTYITMDVDIEKKPKDIINSYMNVPNGLVK